MASGGARDVHHPPRQDPDGTAQRSAREDRSVENLPVYIEPQCLIDSLETSAKVKLKVNHDVLEQIQSLNKSLVVVAVAGPYRTGKSYLLNRLAGASRGFDLGRTVESKTKGIWVWVRPHPKNERKYLLLLDTEGLGDTQKGDRNHDNQIFCLATLLSSMIVFNTIGNINDTALDTISFITGISRHISTRGTEIGDDSDFDYYFPRFVYALRDFCLDLTIEGQEVDGDEYLEYALQLRQPARDARSQQYNETRRCIRKYFTRRKCFTFDRPAGRKLLKCLDTVEDSQLSEDFLEEVETFCNYIVDKSPEKKLDSGSNFNGRMWANLVEEMIKAICEGAIPCINTTVRTVSQTENRRVAEEGLRLYCQLMDSGLCLPTPDDSTLSDFHFQCLTQCVAYFVENAVFDSENTFQINMNTEIEKIFKEYMDKNREASKERCWMCLEDLNKVIATKLENGDYSKPQGHMEYQEDMTCLQMAYRDERGLGVEADTVLLEFLQRKLSEGQSVRMADKAFTQKEKELAEKKQRQLAEEYRQEMDRREQKIREELEREALRAREMNIKEMEEKRLQEIANMEAHHEQLLQERLEEAERLQKEGFKKQAEDMQKQIKLLKAQNAKVKDSKCAIL